MKRLTVVAVVCLAFFSTPLFASKAPSPPMTDEAKATVLSEFSAYVAKLEANQRQNQLYQSFEPSKTAIPTCQTGDADCQYMVEHQQQVQAAEQKIFDNLAQGKYRVTVSFINDENFPYIYLDGKPYQNPTPLSETDRIAYETRIYEHYFGIGYQDFKPELHVVDQHHVVFTVFVNESELEDIARDYRITGIDSLIIPARTSFG